MLFGLQGFAAVAAGTAALVLGGALKALSGGMGGTGSAPAGSSGGGGGSGSTGFSAPDTQFGTPEEMQEMQKPSTNISVNIQGNVLDRRQTGLEISEVIREAFDVQGTTIQTATV
jgi:hypothetical protein